MMMMPPPPLCASQCFCRLMFYIYYARSRWRAALDTMQHYFRVTLWFSPLFCLRESMIIFHAAPPATPFRHTTELGNISNTTSRHYWWGAAIYLIALFTVRATNISYDTKAGCALNDWYYCYFDIISLILSRYTWLTPLKAAPTIIRPPHATLITEIRSFPLVRYNCKNITIQQPILCHLHLLLDDIIDGRFDDIYPAASRSNASMMPAYIIFDDGHISLLDATLR